MSFRDRVKVYHISKAYITAQIDVKHSVKAYQVGQATGNDVTSRDSARRKANDAMILVEKTFQHNLEKMAELLKKVEDFGEESKDSRRERDKFVRYKTAYASNLVLLTQRHEIEELQHHGLLMDLDADPLIKQINSRIERIVLTPLRLALDELVYFYRKSNLKQRTLREMSRRRQFSRGSSTMAMAREGSTIRVDAISVTPSPELEHSPSSISVSRPSVLGVRFPSVLTESASASELDSSTV